MATKLKIGVIVSDDGSIALTQKSAKKLNKELKTMGTSVQQTDRFWKGISEQSSNSSKNFSKVAQTIQGGLVPAYATLAANIFAVSAAFQFLRKSADVTGLIEGQQALGAVTGVAYESITRAVKEATNAQLSYQDAARGVAIGTAAGLSAEQLIGLADAAKNASFALGRDLTDSYNRLIRGVTKAEPELLDELGLILRLDTAAENYAKKLGLVAKDLTTYQKQQSVANEVLTQAEQKYGKIAEAIDPTSQSLNRFLASFDAVVDQIQVILTRGLAPVFEFLSNNILSLSALLTTFGLGLARAILPALPRFANLGEAAEAAEERIRSMANAGSATGKALKKGARIGAKELQRLETAAKAKTTTVLQGSKAERAALLTDLRVYAAQHQLTMAENARGFKRYTAIAIAQLKLLQAESGKVLGTLRFAGAALGRALNIIPFIGGLLLAVDLLKQFASWLNPTSEGARAAQEATKSFVDELEQLNQELERSANIRRAAVLSLDELSVVTGNVVKSANLYNRVIEFRGMRKGAENAENYTEAFRQLRNTFEKLASEAPGYSKFFREFSETGTLSQESLEQLGIFEDELKSIGSAATNLPRTVESLRKNLENLAGVRVNPLTQVISDFDKLKEESALLVTGQEKQFKRLRARQVETLNGVIDKEAELIQLQKEETRILEDTDNVYGKPGALARLGRRQKRARADAAEAQRQNRLANEAYELALQHRTEAIKNDKEINKLSTFYIKLQDIINASEAHTLKLRLKQANLLTAGFTIEDKISNIQSEKIELLLKEEKLKADVAKAEAALEASTEAVKEENQKTLNIAENALAVFLLQKKVRNAQYNEEIRLLTIQKEQNALNIQRNELDSSSEALETRLNYLKEELDLKGQLLQAQKDERTAALQILEARMKIGAFKQRGSTELNPREQLELALDTAKQELEFAVKEAELKKQQIVADNQLQKVKLGILAEEQRILIAETKLEATRARTTNPELAASLERAAARLEELNFDSIVQRQSQLLDTVAEAQLTALDRSIGAALAQSEVAILDAFRGAVEGQEIYQSFREGLKTNLSEFLKGEKSFGEAIGHTIISVLETTADRLFDRAFDLFENAQHIAAVQANTMALYRMTSAITGASLAGGGQAKEGSKGLWGSLLSTIVGAFIPSFGGSTASSASTAASIQQQQQAMTISSGGTLIGAAMGGVMPGGFQAFSDGGIIKEPTLGLVGEGRYNEAVVPLPDGKSIPVMMGGAGATNNTTVNISIEGGQVTRTDQESQTQQAGQLGKLVSIAVQKELQNQQRPGGILSPIGSAR